VNTPASPQNTFQARNFTGTTWRGTVSWQPRESLLAYVSAAKGEKAGGFNNARNPDLQGSFNPETNITWELGVKSEWLDGRLRLNGAVYAIDWSDIQGAAPQRGPGIVPTDPNVIENRGGAESTGLELELGYAFTDSFGATLAASFNDPRYTNATFLASTVSCDGSLCTNGAIVNGAGNNNIDGNSLERQSKTSASLLLSYSGERAGFGVYSNLDFNYQSKQYLEALNLGTTGSRMLANAKLGVTRGPWDVSLWSKSLFDEKYVAKSFSLPTPMSSGLEKDDRSDSPRATNSSYFGTRGIHGYQQTRSFCRARLAGRLRWRASGCRSRVCRETDGRIAAPH